MSFCVFWEKLCINANYKCYSLSRGLLFRHNHTFATITFATITFAVRVIQTRVCNQSSWSRHRDNDDARQSDTRPQEALERQETRLFSRGRQIASHKLVDGHTGRRQFVLLACPTDALAVRPASIKSARVTWPTLALGARWYPTDQGRRLASRVLG